MISPNAGLSVSFSVISAKPIRHKIIETPNFFSGGYNYHGRYELIPVSAMEKAVEVIVKITENVAKNG